MLATLKDLGEYIDLSSMSYGAGPFQPLIDADAWVRDRVKDSEAFSSCPPAVRAATALLAAVYHDDPVAAVDESRVPNMVRLMLLPYC